MGITEWIVAICLKAVIFVWWVYTIIDCAKRDFRSQSEKIVWILVVIFTYCIGAGIYWVFGRPRSRLPMW